MKRKTLRRVLATMLVQAVILGVGGYFVGYEIGFRPEPVTFLHLEPDSYLATFPNWLACQTARNAFDAGRHINNQSAMEIGETGSIETCHQGRFHMGIWN